MGAPGSISASRWQRARSRSRSGRSTSTYMAQWAMGAAQTDCGVTYGQLAGSISRVMPAMSPKRRLERTWRIVRRGMNI